MTEEEQLAMLMYLKHLNDYMQRQVQIIAAQMPADVHDTLARNAHEFVSRTEQHAIVLRDLGDE